VNHHTCRKGKTGSVAKLALLSVSYFALCAVWSPSSAMAQEVSPSLNNNVLPPVYVASPTKKPARKRTLAQSTSTARARRPVQRPPIDAARPAADPWAGDSQTQKIGTQGYTAASTAIATKSNTPLINIPQSVTVVTKDFIKDQNFQGLTDVTRYVPGVAVHQGEGNRDELVIRGVDSSANFFVNGFRDDVQIFRDIYNTQSLEILRGPSALTFGRGSGGGLLNRTLKEADGTRVYDATAQTGSYGDHRFTLDAGQRYLPEVWPARTLRFQSNGDAEAR
jgi:catecholate siderophore receptor